MRALPLVALVAIAALAAPASALGTQAAAQFDAPEGGRCQDPRLEPAVTCNVCVEVLEPVEITDGPRFRCKDTKPPESSAEAPA